MSIATAVLADAPLAYWKLDDPTGPAASDSSGNGNPGVYSGIIDLGLPGPEVGTDAALLHDGALIFSFGDSPRKVRPFSLDMWIALEQVQGTQNNAIYNGAGNVDGTGILLAAGQTLSQPIQVLIGGHAIGAAVGNVTVGAWHHLALTVDVAQNTNMYIDGVNVYLNINTGVWTALVAGDKLQIGANKSGQLCYAAHAAIYPAVLTAAQVLAHFNGNTTSQSPAPVGGVTSITVDALAAKIDEILAAVKHTY